MAEIENLKIGNGGTLHIVGNEDIVANAWQAGKTYVKNKSYVIREHRLYVCNVTHTSVEPFDATKWTEITIGDAIAANTTAIGSLSDLTTSVKSSLVGAVNEVNGKLTKYQDSISANSSKTYTLSSDSKIAFVTANNGAGNTFFGVVSFRNSNEIGFSVMGSFSSISVTTSGMTFTINCTYSTKVTVIVM